MLSKLSVNLGGAGPACAELGAAAAEEAGGADAGGDIIGAASWLVDVDDLGRELEDKRAGERWSVILPQEARRSTLVSCVYVNDHLVVFGHLGQF